jgi:hypothetical protein
MHETEDTPLGHATQVIVLPDDESASASHPFRKQVEAIKRRFTELPRLEKIFKKVLDITHCMSYSVYSTVFEVHHDHRRKHL